MLIYYAAWTDRDIAYHHFDPDCSLLVSPYGVSKSWTTDKWLRLPKQLMIDSGAFQYIRHAVMPTPAEVFQRQAELISPILLNPERTSDCELIFCSPDLPLLGQKPGSRGMYRHIAQGLRNAEAYLDHFNDSLPILPLGVIQGFDSESAYNSARALLNMGYQQFGVGSLAGLSTQNKIGRLFEMIEAVFAALQQPFHLFGVTAARVLERLPGDMIASVDSSSPAREAYNGALLYARPFKRYQVNLNAQSFERLRNYNFTDELKAPLPCECPTCQQDPERLFWDGPKTRISWRTLHNYYQLKDFITGRFPDIDICQA